VAVPLSLMICPMVGNQRTLERTRLRWENNIKMYLRGIGYEIRNDTGSCLVAVMNFRVLLSLYLFVSVLFLKSIIKQLSVRHCINNAESHHLIEMRILCALSDPPSPSPCRFRESEKGN